jgi:hypothetical protein
MGTRLDDAQAWSSAKVRITMLIHMPPFDPTMKTERVTLLTSPEFKAFLTAPRLGAKG